MKKISSLLFFIFIVVTLQSAPLFPMNLTCEFQKNPLGIDVSRPRLSWNFKAEGRNQFQTAYEILVSDNRKLLDADNGSSWKSGIIQSTENILIEYNGAALVSRRRYYWKVRTYDASKRPSAWSETAWFETGFMNANEWKARWIGDGSMQFQRDEDFYKQDPMPLFKVDFSSSSKIESARLYIAGLGYYEAFLNEQKIGDQVLDPGFTAYRKQVLYVTHDVTKQIRTGKNTLGVMLGNGWYNPLPLRLFSRFNLRDVQETGRPKLIAQLEITYADGTRQTILSDETWKTAKGPVVRNNVYLGEEYDARMEKKFSSNDGWVAAVVTSEPSGALSPQIQPAIKVTKVVQPVSVKQISKDTFIVDMGQNFAGVARIKVKGAAGTRIGLRYGEDIFKNGRLNYLTTVAGQIKEIWNLSGGPGSPKTAWQRDEYILKGTGTEIWSPRFTFHGFRYVEITGWPGTPTVNDIDGLRMNADLESNGNFQSSDSMFNKLHDVVQWTFLSNVFSVQSDCPGREKMGYGGDMVATAEAFIFNYNMTGFYKKTINDFANDQQPDGGITEIAPSTGIADRGYGGQSGPLGWQLAFPFLQKQLYEYYGDKRIIETYYPAFQKQMEFLQSKSQQGLFFWDISDHEALDTKPEALTAACFYYHHALLATEFAGILHKKDDSLKYARLASGIKNAILSRYYLHNTGRFDNGTQSAQLFALWYGLSPEKERSIGVLKEEFKRHKDHISTGIFSTKMLFDVLRENDMEQQAFKLVDQNDFPGWKHMLLNGATTLWETWQYPDNAPSQNHPMFGSVDEWFYKSILGINAGAPGFKKIIIKPQPGGNLTWAKGYYQSVRGIISTDWKKADGKFQLSVTVPPNCTTTIYIPSGKSQKITESSQSLGQSISIQSRDDKYVVVEVGSGDYKFLVE